MMQYYRPTCFIVHLLVSFHEKTFLVDTEMCNMMQYNGGPNFFHCSFISFFLKKFFKTYLKFVRNILKILSQYILSVGNV